MLRWLLALSLTLPVLAAPPVHVYEVKGPSFQYQRGADWRSGSAPMDGYVKDHYRTDAETVAALELGIGGRVGIKKSTEVEVLNEGEVAVSNSTQLTQIVLKSGGVWAKFNKQDQPLTIQTRGGVIGIRGTELEVDSNEEGECEVSLLEGEVDFRDLQGEVTRLRPGQKLRLFLAERRLQSLTGLPEEVDAAVAQVRAGRLKPRQLAELRRRLARNAGRLKGSALQRHLKQMRKRAHGRLGRDLSTLVLAIESWKPRRR